MTFIISVNRKYLIESASVKELPSYNFIILLLFSSFSLLELDEISGEDLIYNRGWD